MAQMAPSANVVVSEKSTKVRGFPNLEVARSAPAIPRANPNAASHPTTPKGAEKKETRILPPEKEHYISPYRSPSPLATDIEDAVQRAESPLSDNLAHTPTRKPTSKGASIQSRGLSPILGLNTQPVRSDRSETPDSTSSLRRLSTQMPSSRSIVHGDKGNSRVSQEDIKNVCIVPYFPKFLIAPLKDKSQPSSDADIVSQGQTSTSVRSRSVELKKLPRPRLHSRSSSDIDGRKALLAFSKPFSQGENNRIGDVIIQSEPKDEKTSCVC